VTMLNLGEWKKKRARKKRFRQYRKRQLSISCYDDRFFWIWIEPRPNLKIGSTWAKWSDTPPVLPQEDEP
jgi:hypothetical protein